MNPQPLIAVRDVAAASAWYQDVLGLKSFYGGSEYDQLRWEDILVLQLHRWDAHELPHLGDAHKPGGNGVALWFQTDYFDEAMKRISAHKAHILEGPKVNREANHREVWLRDPDGYVVVVAGALGDLGKSG